MTTIGLCPESEFPRLVFTELGIGEEDLKELNVDKWPLAFVTKRVRLRQLTFHRASAASIDDLVVVEPYENPAPMG